MTGFDKVRQGLSADEAVLEVFKRLVDCCDCPCNDLCSKLPHTECVAVKKVWLNSEYKPKTVLDKENPKPCPFCGAVLTDADVKHSNRFGCQIKCHSCGATLEGANRASVIKLWNVRI